MERYYISNGNGLFISTKGGIHAVNKIENASLMDDKKAHNVLNTIPKPLKNGEWKIQLFEDTLADDRQEIDLSQFNYLTNNILEKMLDVENYMKKLKEYNSLIDSELQKIQLEIIDIEHAAEFYDLDLYKGWKIYKMLQDARKRRRKYKDEKAKIEYILKSNFIDCTNSAISNYIKSLDHRHYNPRVLNELFNV